MTLTGSYEDLYRKEISKYDHICEEITQNIEAQEQLLLQIQVYWPRNPMSLFFSTSSTSLVILVNNGNVSVKIGEFHAYQLILRTMI